jgi:CRISPR/Cas system-associated exonuclease Cas4 (RecB family)
VEIKRHGAGRFGPRDRDVQQLLTYCVPAEDVWGATVTHGLIEYRDGRVAIPYGPVQRRQVLDLAEGVRRDRVAADVARDHRDARKCGRCGYSDTCGQALSGR